MSSHLSVVITGPALAFLLFENNNSPGNQEGFLLGEVVSHVTDTISDAQIHGEKTETFIHINYIMPIPSTLMFFNGAGRVDRKAMKEFLGDKEKEVVGWYNFRRNVRLAPFLRDKLLHKEFCAALPHVTIEHFAMFLLTAVITSGGSTHTFSHKFYRYRQSYFSKYEPLSMRIYNLGETQPEYKTVPSPACLSDSFKNIVASVTDNQEDISDVEIVNRIQEALQNHLKILVEQVAESDREVAELEEEVRQLRLQNQPVHDDLQQDKENMEGASCSSAPIQTPGKSSISQPSTSYLIEGVADSNRIKYGGGVVVEMKHAEASEPFAYVTEMKIQMSQPAKDSPSCSKSNIKRDAAGRAPAGAVLGSDTGRGNRGKKQQQTPATIQNNIARGRENKPVETFPGLHNKQLDPSVNSSSNPKNMPATPSSGGKRRGNYAQALKRPGNPGVSSDAGTKSIPKARGTGESSGSQEY